MILFFAGGIKSIFQDILYSRNAKNVLSSFYWDKKEDLKTIKEKGFNIFLDSGGYSARKQGVNINVQEYGNYLQKNKDYIFTAANLDVMDLEQALENQKYLEQIYPVLPVYHYSEYAEKNEQLLKDFCDKYSYIAIGGIAGMNPDKRLLKNFLNYCFRTITKYKNKKVHGFGMTSLNLLKEYPFYSVDSTAWLVGGKFGTILKWKEMKMENNIHYSDKEQMINENIPIELINDYKNRLANNTEELLKMEKWITKLWKIRGIEFKD